MAPKRGFIFASTGPEYIALACRAARSLKQHCPDTPIDLFADAPVADEVFAKVHQLETSWFRPKMEGLYRSRFEQTIYLDSDLFVIADIRDVFDVLDGADMAAAHDQFRNTEFAHQVYKNPVPAAFPQHNGGLIGVSHNEKTQTFLKNWERAVRDDAQKRDQPAFRELLFNSSLNMRTLPSEYNVNRIDLIRALNSIDPAPRVIHHHTFHQHIGTDLVKINSVKDLLGTRLNNQVQDLLATDTALSDSASQEYVRAFCDRYPGKRVPSSHRTKNMADLKNRFKHPFRGTYGEKWYRTVKGWFS